MESLISPVSRSESSSSYFFIHLENLIFELARRVSDAQLLIITLLPQTRIRFEKRANRTIQDDTHEVIRFNPLRCVCSFRNTTSRIERANIGLLPSSGGTACRDIL
jgi:hypothetical protein